MGSFKSLWLLPLLSFSVSEDSQKYPRVHSSSDGRPPTFGPAGDTFDADRRLLRTIPPRRPVTVELIIEYFDDVSRDAVLAAVDDIVFDLPAESTLVARVRQKEKLALLKGIPNIQYGINHPINSPDDSVRPMEHVANVVDPHSQKGHRDVAEKVTAGITMIQANQLQTGNANVTVCIADTGYAFHPDLPTPPRVDGVDLTLDDGTVLEWNVTKNVLSHGTMLAGIIAATRGNDIGLQGVVEPNLFITRGLKNDGKGTLGHMMAAVDQCVMGGADVIVASLGCPDCDNTAVGYFFRNIAQRQGKIVVASAGNLGTASPFFPASFPDCISVAAVDNSGNKMGMSNYNDAVEVAAPGESVYSTWISSSGRFGYGLMDGTSGAAAFVGGAAALLWSHFPQCKNHHIRNALARTAKNSNGCDVNLGHGIVQVRDAYELMKQHGCEAGGFILSGTERTCDAPLSHGKSLGVNSVPGHCSDSDIIEVHMNGKKATCKKLRRKARWRILGAREKFRERWCTESDARYVCKQFCEQCS